MIYVLSARCIYIISHSPPESNKISRTFHQLPLSINYPWRGLRPPKSGVRLFRWRIQISQTARGQHTIIGARNSGNDCDTACAGLEGHGSILGSDAANSDERKNRARRQLAQQLRTDRSTSICFALRAENRTNPQIVRACCKSCIRLREITRRETQNTLRSQQLPGQVSWQIVLTKMHPISVECQRHIYAIIDDQQGVIGTSQSAQRPALFQQQGGTGGFIAQLNDCRAPGQRGTGHSEQIASARAGAIGQYVQFQTRSEPPPCPRPGA